MSDAKATVLQLSLEGVSLVEIIMSGRYSESDRVEALRQLHVNVRDIRIYEVSKGG